MITLSSLRRLGSLAADYEPGTLEPSKVGANHRVRVFCEECARGRLVHEGFHDLANDVEERRFTVASSPLKHREYSLHRVSQHGRTKQTLNEGLHLRVGQDTVAEGLELGPPRSRHVVIRTAPPSE